jgi:hypothetical protein
MQRRASARLASGQPDPCAARVGRSSTGGGEAVVHSRFGRRGASGDSVRTAGDSLVLDRCYGRSGRPRSIVEAVASRSSERRAEGSKLEGAWLRGSSRRGPGSCPRSGVRKARLGRDRLPHDPPGEGDEVLPPRSSCDQRRIVLITMAYSVPSVAQGLRSTLQPRLSRPEAGVKIGP